MKKISVVMSVYNGERFIEQQMESLRKQNRCPDEVLIFDDCSIDQTAEIVQMYINKYELYNWYLIKNEQNKGWRRNFIEGFRCSTGTLIFPCDQDDYWHFNKIKIMEEIMDHNDDINLLVSNYTAIDKKGKTKNGPIRSDGKVKVCDINKKVFLTPYPGCTYCFRRNMLDYLDEYWQEDFPHDATLWRLALLEKSVFSYNSSLINWNRRSDSTYTLESIKSKSYESKSKWIDYGLDCVTQLQKFIVDREIKDAKINKIIDDNGKWLMQRKTFYNTRKVLEGIKLLKYIRYYPRIRQYLGDWYLIYIKTRN